MKNSIKQVAENRRASYLYDIIDTYETGIELKGMEVKSLRTQGADLRDAYARVDKGELYLYNMNIAPYRFAGAYGKVYEPKRKRRLLVTKQEINRISGQVTQKGYTLIPLEVYFKGSWLKVKLSLAKGKKVYDRREKLRRRALDRELREY